MLSPMGAVSGWMPKLPPAVTCPPSPASGWLRNGVITEAGGVVWWHRGLGTGVRGTVMQGARS